ncbi:flagellar biosynthesis protein FlgM, partial [bacterium c-19]|nr:flagellar biosynthesis protein FlgM [bacterium c-19]
MKKISVFVACLMLMSVVGCSKSLKVTVKENAVLEYGEKPDYSLLFDKDNSDEGVTVKEVKSFDNKKIGEQEITVIFINADEKTKEETLKVTVKDTKKPEIKLKKDKLEITEDDKFDAVANIESVKDPVDGDIKKSDDQKLTKNGYFITSDVDVKKAGSYTVKITAFDVNGNKAESSYKVT